LAAVAEESVTGAYERVFSFGGTGSSFRRTAPLSSSSSRSSAPELARLHARTASRAPTKLFSCSMTGAGHPRRVAIMGPIRSDASVIATVAENRLQPVLPVTCCGVSNVIVGTDEGDAVAAAPPARRQVL